MFGFAAALSFAISFILYATKDSTDVPWTPMGFVILGLLFLALHVAWPWYPGGRRP